MYACSSVRRSSLENGTNGRRMTKSSPVAGGVPEHRVVRREAARRRPPTRAPPAPAPRSCSAPAPARRGGLAGVDARRLGHRPGALALEELLGLELVLGVDVGLHPEQVLRVPQVLAQLGRHLRAGREEVAERALPRLDDRVVGVVDVERDRAVVGVDDGLDAVADVVRIGVDAAVVGQAAPRCRCAGRTGSGSSTCSASTTHLTRPSTTTGYGSPS